MGLMLVPIMGDQQDAYAEEQPPQAFPSCAYQKVFLSHKYITCHYIMIIYELNINILYTVVIYYCNNYKNKVYFFIANKRLEY